MTIFTHLNVDLDAVCSVWAARRFIPGARYARVEFRPANWDGALMEESDLALDIDAGGRGIKGERGEDGTVHSCFASIMAQYAPGRDQIALQHLVTFVDVQDSEGSAVNVMLPRASREARAIMAVTGLNAVLYALKAVNPGKDYVVVHKFSEVLDGLLHVGRARIRAHADADKTEMIAGKVALVTNNSEFSTVGILFERGVRAVVFIDGYNLGVVRHRDEKLPMDYVEIRAVVEECGELKEWFAHPSGFLFARGTRKSPAQTPSKVDPRRLAEAVARAVS